jgi:hypothetical protein
MVKFIRWLWQKIEYFFKPNLKHLFVDDIPILLKPKKIYIIGQTENTWLIIMECPCGCKSNIQLNLLEEFRPCWRFKIDKNKMISIYPSIWRKVGCKSHFWIKSGQIIWVKDNFN